MEGYNQKVNQVELEYPLFSVTIILGMDVYYNENSLNWFNSFNLTTQRWGSF